MYLFLGFEMKNRLINQHSLSSYIIWSVWRGEYSVTVLQSRSAMWDWSPCGIPNHVSSL